VATQRPSRAPANRVLALTSIASLMVALDALVVSTASRERSAAAADGPSALADATR